MKKLLTRAATGAVYVAAIVCAILFGQVVGFSLLCMVFAALALNEFFRMTKKDMKSQPEVTFIDNGAALLLIAQILLVQVAGIFFWCAAFLSVVLIIVRMVVALYQKDVVDPVSDVALSIMGVFYVALPLMCAILLLMMSQYLLLLVFVMIWLNDTGAFLVGSAIGRHRLCERLSPKKSWEGFWGGMAFSIAAGIVATLLWPAAPAFNGPVWRYIGLGIIVSLFATWGDLFESMIKRHSGVKDSGNILPGHGGMLDRIDSLLFVAPAALIYMLVTDYI